jgi:exosortase|tara:strand:- start:25044 stop:26369 length:1326 start_codon:yes stop_codon:yes gene_type:complete
LIIFKHYLPLVILAILYLIIALTQLTILDNIWRYSFDDGTYSHAYLIPFISIYLYWILFQSGELVFNNKLSLPILMVSVLIAYLLWVSMNAQFPTGYRICFVLFITSMTSLIFKPSIRQMFPALFLIFLVPIWGIATHTLQNISTYAVTYMMNLTHIPIYVEGNRISIPAGVFEIAGGCSGLRYLIVSLAISSLFIFLNIRKYSHAFTFLGLAIIGALVVNWLRITLLILIGHYTDMQSSLMHDHNSFGWYLYIPFMIALFYFGRRYTRIDINKATTEMDHKVKPATIYAVLIITLAVSTQVSDVSNEKKSYTSNCDNLSSAIAQPELAVPPTSCHYTYTDGHNIIYKYAGANIESSVDYYLNNFTPTNWQVIHRSQEQSVNILLVSQNNNNCKKITYSFTSGNTSTHDLAVLKKLKLINAFTGQSETTLHWKVQDCEAPS